MAAMLPRVVYEGECAYADIPARLGVAPTMPVYMVWDMRLEAYVPVGIPQRIVDAFLVRLAERAACEDLAVHYWRVRDVPPETPVRWGSAMTGREQEDTIS